MTSLRVSWNPPKLRNGEIIGYVLTYETTEQNDRKSPDHNCLQLFLSLNIFAEYSKQVKQKITETSLLVQPLEEEVTYTFVVRAQTIDFGPPVSGNITTGPQEGSPMVPSKLAVTKTISSVDLTWINGASGKGPILGYYIETRRKGAFNVFLHKTLRGQRNRHFLLICSHFCVSINRFSQGRMAAL